MFKKTSFITITIAFNIAIAANSFAFEPPPAIYADSDDPLTLDSGKPYTVSGMISRPLILKDYLHGFRTDTQITINNSISNLDSNHTAEIWKLGSGLMQLNGASDFEGYFVLYEGSLALGDSNALGNNQFNVLEMATGSTLILKDGVDINQQISIDNAGAIYKDTNWDPDPALAYNNLPVSLHVDSGTATLSGSIGGFEVVDKTGAGSLRINGTGITFNDLNVKQGRLDVNGLWLGHVNTWANTTLGGTGFITSANVAGYLNPGAPDLPGQINIDQLELMPSAITTIRLHDKNSYDSIYSMDSAQLDGGLVINTSDHVPTGKYTIVNTDDLNHSRFANVYGPKTYISPKIIYNDKQICTPGSACQTVVLNLQYNDLGLNYDIANWQAATIMDSRFIRDAANAHSDSGRAWAQAWFANSTWHNTDRDTSGMQIGKSFKLNQTSQLAAFAGIQNTNWRNNGNEDQAIFAGLAYNQTWGPIQFKVGHAIASHRSHIKRQADPNEAQIKSHPKAINNQSWLHISPTHALNLNHHWSVKPYAEINYIHSRLKSLHEHDSQAAIHSPSQSQQLWLGQIGIDINSQWDTKHGTAIMHTKLGLVNNFSKDRLKNRQSYRLDDHNYKVYSQRLPKTSVRLDLGVKADIAKATKLELAYTGEHSKQQKQHGIWGGVNMVF